MTRSYRLASLRIESEFDLTGLMAWDGPTDAAADVVVRRGDVPERLDGADHIEPVFQTRGHSEYLLALPHAGRILVRGGREVTIAPGADGPDRRALLTGPVQAVLWHQRGLLPLHASVVDVDGRAVALAGPSAAGKSTLAAALSAMGHPAMADDIAVIEMGDGGARVLPGLPHLRLWRDALDHFGIAPDGLVRALSSKEKYFVAPSGGYFRAPRQLAAVVILSRQGDRTLAIERLRGSQAVGALHAVVHTRRPARALGRDREIFLALTRLVAAGVTVWRLKMPDDHAGLAPAAAAVLGALEE